MTLKHHNPSIFFYLLIIAGASAQTWDGESESGLWSTPNNWSGDTPPVSSATNDLHFSGLSNLENTNDFISFILQHLFFDSNAGSFVLNGNDLTMYGDVQNNSVNFQTINNNINFQAPGTLNAAVGDLVFNGLIDNGGFTLTTDGPFNIDLNNTLSGAGSLVKNGAGTLTLNASNNYGGSTFVNEGTLITSHSNALRGSPALTVQNGAKLLNPTTHPSGAGFFHNTAANRSALITGPGSLWSNAGVLTVGITGAFNSLTISNGGMVISTAGIVGRAGASANNSVTVDGSGSIWSNRDAFVVGGRGSSNRLSIRNGAQVFSSDGFIGSNSSFNTVLVTDPGSSWIITNELFVGNGSLARFNSMVISNGGSVSDQHGHVGYNNNATNNSVLVTGAGSTWSNSGNLFIGNNGSDNSRLVISDGGKVVNENGHVAHDLLGTLLNNSALITGSGSIWSNRGDLIIGESGSRHNVVVADQGTLQVNDQLVIGAIGLGIKVGRSNSVTVSDSGTLLNVGNALLIGNGFSGENMLLITNGAQVKVGGQLRMGAASATGPITVSADNNKLIVTGTGSTLNVGDHLDVGSSASSNLMIINNGATLTSVGGTIGEGTSASNNTVWVDGIGSTWSNSGNLMIGVVHAPPLASHGNTLSISNGALVFNQNATLGFGEFTSSNRVIVSGPGSTWNNLGNVVIGNGGHGNSVFINNSGTVWAANMTLGASSFASNNVLHFMDSTLMVTGILHAVHGHVTMDGNYASIGTLLVTNESTFTFNRGNLYTQNAHVDNGRVFLAGDGINYATYTLESDGIDNSHTFVNGLTMNTNTILYSTTSERLNDETDLRLDDSRWVLSTYDETLRNLAFNGGTLQVDDGSSLVVTSGFISNHIGGATLQVDGGTFYVNAAIVGDGSLTKTAAGGLMLDGVSTYTGITSIIEGKFTINGVLAPSVNDVTMYSGTTISGTGTVYRTVHMEEDSTMDPGYEMGTLTVENLNIKTGVDYIYQRSATDVDCINVNGDLRYTDNPTVTLRLEDLGGAYWYVTNILINYGTSDDDVIWVVDYGTTGVSGGIVRNNTDEDRWELIFPTIPEPSTLGLLTLSFWFLLPRKKSGKSALPQKRGQSTSRTL